MILDTDTLEAEKEYLKLDALTKYNERVEPLKYKLKLVVGLLFAILSICVILQLVLCNFLKNDTQGPNSCKVPFLNQPLEWLQRNDFGFISIFIYLLYAMYILYAAYSGNKKLGQRLYIPTYYPLTPNETLYNGLLYNVTLFNIWTFAILQLCVSSLKEWLYTTRADYIYNERIITFVFHGYIYLKDIFLYMTLMFSAGTFVYLALRPKDSNIIQEIKKAKDSDSDEDNEESLL